MSGRWLGAGRAGQRAVVTGSPLRRVDPRVKLALSTLASLAVMLPWQQLAVFMALYALLLLWGRLLPAAARQVWRLKWLLALLLVVDWLVVGPELAVAVVLRVILLAGVFTLVVGTTTPDELRLALERLHVPYRYAFGLSLAFQSVRLLDDEWRAIHEAQKARGAFSSQQGLRGLLRGLREWVALTVPAVVLTTHRAWAMTEAASARGLEAPHRRPYRQLSMEWMDWALLCLALVAMLAFLVW